MNRQVNQQLSHNKLLGNKERHFPGARARRCFGGGYKGQGLVFVAHISTKPGHVSSSGKLKEAQPQESILAGWFRHRAEKFLSGSVIQLRSRTALRSAEDQRQSCGGRNTRPASLTQGQQTLSYMKQATPRNSETKQWDRL